MSLAGSAVLGDPGGARANQGESEPRISTVEILPDDLFDHRTKEPELPLEAALVLRKEALELMGKHAVENRPLRMPRTMDSRHGGINVSRIGPGLAGKTNLPRKNIFYLIPYAAIKLYFLKKIHLSGGIPGQDHREPMDTAGVETI